MNLHKVKGLEAPVVFLADPGGKPRGGCRLHVDRTGERIVGYLAVEQQAGQFARKVLAHPHDWDALADEEEHFAAAERSRLLYVAATRAGSQLVVTRRPGRGSHHSPWEFFRGWLDDAPELRDPGPQRAPATGRVTVTPDDVAAAEASIAERWPAAGAATFDLRGAKELAVSAAELHRRPAAGEHGTEWGTVIHFLLETALREPGLELAEQARSALEEQGLPSSRAAEALAVVAAVRASGIWRRAVAAERLLVETPFDICLHPGDPLLDAAGEGPGAFGTVPVLVRGVVDLAFRESTGWVIVDWKTDAARTPAELAERARRYAPQVRLYAEIWSRITGEPVAERGLYFTGAGHFEPV
jgi:ATP-dependent helicase/nuclease subunit A